MRNLDIVAFVLMVVGALNWGLIGIFDFNLVSSLFGIDTFISNLIYILVAASAIYLAFAVRPAIKRNYRSV